MRRIYKKIVVLSKKNIQVKETFFYGSQKIKMSTREIKYAKLHAQN